ncbi:MAG: hypothetical protein ACK51R_09795 [Hyphomonadaceae bacterium]|jgi:hypothetical protein|nr:hypothetical protein [Hyphomonadaceae bacterium]
MSEVINQTRPGNPWMKFVVGTAIWAIVGGISGYLLATQTKGTKLEDAVRLVFERDFVSFMSVLLGFILLGIYVFSAIIFALAIVNKRVANNRALTGGLGSSPSSRKAYPYILTFYVAYTAILGVLTFYQFHPQGLSSMSWPLFLIGLTSGVAMVWTGHRLWFLLDEFFRAIWLEAGALASYIMLVIVLAAGCAMAAGLMPAASLYSGLVLYQIIYLIAYGWVAGKRDPNMLEMGEPEEA